VAGKFGIVNIARNAVGSKNLWRFCSIQTDLNHILFITG